MRIRLKLLILLLVIALVPLVTVTWYDLRATRDLGVELTRRAREVLSDRAEKQLLVSVQDSAQLLRRERKLFELAVKLQAQAVEEALGKAPPKGEAAPAVLLGDDAAVAVTVEGPATAQADAWRARLSALVPELERLRRNYAPNALWQRVVLEGGVQAVYPAALFDNGAPEPWYQRAREHRDLVVMPPHQERWTGMPVLTVAAPILGPNGRFLGAAAIDAPLTAVLADVAAEPVKPTRLLIAAPVDADNGGQALRVFAERGAWGIAARDVLHRTEQAPGLPEVLADMTAGKAGVRQVFFENQNTLWAYVSIDDERSHLLFIVPFADVIADALATQAYVFDQLAVQRRVLWLSLIVFVPVLIGLAVFASQAVTQPVKQLAEAARQLARGNFRARTHITSGDELEELGRLFNVMVPQLDASIRMRDSLALAQEVQQNLLPRQAPDVPGFDIAGRSIYCDETGGDYYDFLEVPSLGPASVAVLIGDVAGHGIAAALMMTTTRALLRSREPEPGRLAEVVSTVNRQLCRDTHAGRFVTLFLAVLDGTHRRVNWVVAGHEPGFIYHPAADSFLEVSGPDIPLGVVADWQYEEQSHDGWEEGTILLLGTDGIWETRGPGGAMFGKDTVRAIIRDNAARPAAEIVDAIATALTRFRQGRPQVDDITLIVVKAGEGPFIAPAKRV